MITNQGQLTASQEKLKMLQKSLIAKPKDDIPQILRDASSGQTQELINEIDSEIEEYSKVKQSSADK